MLLRVVGWCCLMFVGKSCLWFVVRCSLFVVRCLLFVVVVYGALIGSLLLLFVCLQFVAVVYRWSCVVGDCLLFVRC